MAYLLLGLVVFFGVHALPWCPSCRQSLIERLGRLVYLGLFSLLSLVGLVLMVWGYRQTLPEIWWTPVAGARFWAQALMPLVFILLVSAYLNTHIRSYLKHPMLIGVLLWSLVHLLANGDAASTPIFTAFLLYALLDMGLNRPRQRLIPMGRPRWRNDLLALVAGLLLFMGVLHGHGALFGVALF